MAAAALLPWLTIDLWRGQGSIFGQQWDQGSALEVGADEEVRWQPDAPVRLALIERR